MLFWPTMMVPLASEAEMWWEKFELIAGITRIRSEETSQMLLSRYIALSKLPLKSRAPVRNKLPTLAEEKSKVDDGGRARLRISRLRRLKNDLMSSFFAGVIDLHSADVPSTIASHSLWAESSAGSL